MSTSEAPPFVSVVIPAYNEERRLPPSLGRVIEYLRTFDAGGFEVIVVDDGSSDGTAALVEQYAAAEPRIRLLRNPGNRGKGYAVRNGMLHAAGAWVLFSDADLSTPIEELEKLLDACRNSGAAVAIGSRALDRSLVSVHQSMFREFSGRIFNVLVRVVSGLPFKDTQCGFKLYSRNAVQQVFPRQQLDGFSFDVEDLYIAVRLGFQVVEVPVRWANVEGTKVGGLAGVRSFLDVLKVRWFSIQGRYSLTLEHT